VIPNPKQHLLKPSRTDCVVKKIRVATAVSLTVAPLVFSLTLGAPMAANAAPPAPTADYTFEGNTLDSANGSTLTLAPSCPADPCNTSTSFGTEGGDGFLEWSSSNLRGGGFVIDTNTSFTPTYTLLMKFSFADFSGYRKIIDYKNRADDTGFYIYNSRINFYPLGTSTDSFTAGQAMTLMVTRQATTGSSGIFTVYSYDGTTFNQELQVTDTTGSSLPAASTVHAGGTKIGFFFDDTATPREATSSGKVFSVKTWNGTALSAADLETVSLASSDDPTPSESDTSALPSTGTDMSIIAASVVIGGGLLVAGALALIMARRRPERLRPFNATPIRWPTAT